MAEVDPRNLNGKEYIPISYINCEKKEDILFLSEGDSVKLKFCNDIKQAIPESYKYIIKNGKFKLI